MFRVKSLDNTEEFERAGRFIAKIAFERYRCRPPPSPQILFGAFQKDELVGTISLDFSSNGCPLNLERIWVFDCERTPFPFNRELIAQFGRWMSLTPGCSVALFQAATLYAISQRRKYFLAEAKDKIADRLRELRFPIKKVEDARLITENVPEDGRAYYAEDPPSLYMAELYPMLDAILKSPQRLESLNLEFS